MNWPQLLQTAAAITLTGVALGAGIGGFWYAFKSKDNKLLHEQLRETKAAVDRCEAKHVESERSVANLQGQIDVLKNVPLASIDASLSSQTTSLGQILSVLQNSALIAATDRDTLLNNTHIGEQHVEHQIVETETINKKGVKK